MARPTKYTRRGRPYANLNRAEVVRLRDEQELSWRAIGKRLGIDFNSARRAYTRTQTTAGCITIRPTKRRVAGMGVPLTGSDGVVTPQHAEESGAVTQAA